MTCFLAVIATQDSHGTIGYFVTRLFAAAAKPG